MAKVSYGGWGYGANAFADGFVRGLDIYEKMRKIGVDKDYRDEAAEANEEYDTTKGFQDEIKRVNDYNKGIAAKYDALPLEERQKLDAEARKYIGDKRNEAISWSAAGDETDAKNKLKFAGVLRDKMGIVDDSYIDAYGRTAKNKRDSAISKAQIKRAEALGDIDKANEYRQKQEKLEGTRRILDTYNGLFSQDTSARVKSYKEVLPAFNQLNGMNLQIDEKTGGLYMLNNGQKQFVQPNPEHLNQAISSYALMRMAETDGSLKDWLAQRDTAQKAVLANDKTRAEIGALDANADYHRMRAAGVAPAIATSLQGSGDSELAQAFSAYKATGNAGDAHKGYFFKDGDLGTIVFRDGKPLYQVTGSGRVVPSGAKSEEEYVNWANGVIGTPEGKNGRLGVMGSRPGVVSGDGSKFMAFDDKTWRPIETRQSSALNMGTRTNSLSSPVKPVRSATGAIPKAKNKKPTSATRGQDAKTASQALSAAQIQNGLGTIKKRREREKIASVLSVINSALESGMSEKQVKEKYPEEFAFYMQLLAARQEEVQQNSAINRYFNDVSERNKSTPAGAIKFNSPSGT